jgi:hypothetical protein
VSELLIGPDDRADEVRVERILVQRHVDRRDRGDAAVRLAHLVAEFTTVAEVAQYIDLAALVPDPRPRT